MDDIKQQLTSLDLTVNEIQVYLYLIEKGGSKPAFIAKEVGMRRPNVYGVLDKLMEYGLIEILHGLKGKVYVANDIQQGLHNLVQKEQDKVDGKVKLANELVNTLSNLRKGVKDNKAIETFSEGARSMVAIGRLFETVESEVLNISHPPYFSALFHKSTVVSEKKDEKEDNEADESKPGYLTDAKQRNIQNYRIYQIEDVSLDSIKTLAHKNLKPNIIFKFARKTPGKLLIFDRCYIAMGAVSPDSNEPIEDTAIIYNPGLAEMLAQSFFVFFDSLQEITSLEDAEKMYEHIQNTS